jgi:hypothetical protein
MRSDANTVEKRLSLNDFVHISSTTIIAICKSLTIYADLYVSHYCTYTTARASTQQTEPQFT